jgi:hypothetical protein
MRARCFGCAQHDVLSTSFIGCILFTCCLHRTHGHVPAASRLPENPPVGRRLSRGPRRLGVPVKIRSPIFREMYCDTKADDSGEGVQHQAGVAASDGFTSPFTSRWKLMLARSANSPTGLNEDDSGAEPSKALASSQGKPLASSAQLCTSRAVKSMPKPHGVEVSVGKRLLDVACRSCSPAAPAPARGGCRCEKSGIKNGWPRCSKRRFGLQKDDRRGGHFVVQLGNVVGVVAADADDFHGDGKGLGT